MKKKYYCMMMVVILVSNVYASVFSSQYPIGTYSYLGNKNYVYNNRDAFCSYLHDMGYNTSIIEVFSPGGTTVTDYNDLYDKFYDHELDAIVMDKRWDMNNQYSTYALSTGSYHRFEAEYSSGTEVTLGDNLKSRYWYRSRTDNHATRVGKVYTFDNDSWQCERGVDPVGFAYTDLKWRWNTAAGDSVRIGKEFLVKKLDTPDNDNFIYITYNLSVSDFPNNVSSTTPLLGLMPCGFPYEGSGYATVENTLLHYNYSNAQTGEATLFTYGDYLGLGSPLGAFTITLRVSYSELLLKDLFAETDNWWKRVLVNLNPRLMWYGNCDLLLDYIEIEDQLFHNMKTVNNGTISLNPTVANQMNNQISTIYPSSHPELVTSVYTFDEPTQPLWKSYQMIEDASNSTMMSACYDLRYHDFPLTDAPGKYYDNIEAFLDVTSPKVIMPDIYPLRHFADRWVASFHDSLQYYIDTKLTSIPFL